MMTMLLLLHQMICRQIIPTFYGVMKNILILLLAHKKLDKFGDLFVTFLTINIEPEEGSEFLRNQPVLLIAVLLPCQFIHIT